MRMRLAPSLRMTLTALAVTAAPTVASAQQVIAEFYTLLSAQDAVNSSGQPLGSICAVVAQDRANFHRFNRRDQMDNSDPLFFNRDMRALIPSICQEAGGGDSLFRGFRQYGSTFARVVVFGQGGVPTLMLVYQGAG